MGAPERRQMDLAWDPLDETVEAASSVETGGSAEAQVGAREAAPGDESASRGRRAPLVFARPGRRPRRGAGAPEDDTEAEVRPLRMPATAIDRPVLESAADDGYELESEVPRFRRRARLPRHRPSKLLRLVRTFLVALVAVGGPAVLGVWLATAPQFAVERIEAPATPRVSEAWLADALEPLRGQNLLRLSLPAVRGALAGHPWIAGVAVRKDLPDGLTVMVEERRPAAVAASGEGGGEEAWVYLDADGRPIAPVEGAPVELPRLTGLPTDPAFADEAAARARAALAVVEEVRALDLPWSASLEEIRVLGPEDFLLRSPEAPFPFLVRGGAVAAKLPYLDRVLPSLQESAERVAAVDLRFDRRIVVRRDELETQNPDPSKNR